MKQEDTFSFSALVEKKRLTGSDFNPVSRPHSQGQPPVPPVSVVLPRPPEESALAFPSADYAEVEAEGRKLHLPFDPLRAADALWRHKLLVVGVGIVLGALGFGIGAVALKPGYAATSTLLRQELPDTFRASEIGTPFKPLDVSIPVLTGSLMKSGYLLDRVSAQTKPRLSPGEIAGNIDIVTEKNSGTIRIGYVSKASAAQAAGVLGIYTNEVVRLTKELESGDADAINELLTKQIERCDKELREVDESLLRYAREADLIDADKEITSHLGELANMDLKMHSAKLDYETLDVKINSVERELGNLNSAATRLQKAKEDLGQLLSRYTEQNPIVISQMDAIKSLEEEMNSGKTSGAKFIEPGGNPIAEGLYLSRVEMLAQKDMLGEQLHKFEDVRNGITSKLQELPRKSLEYALIKAQRTSMEKARELLAGRQREANSFLQNPVGRYRILNAPRAEDVRVNSRVSTMISLMMGGLVGGLFLGAGLIIVRELKDSRIKTPADLARTTGLSVLVTLPEEIQKDAEAQQAWGLKAWTHLRSTIGSPDRALVCGLLAEKDGESHVLAKALGDAAAWRDCAVLVVTSKVPDDKPSVNLTEAVSGSRASADTWLAQDTGLIYIRENEEWTWTPEQRAMFQQSMSLWSRHAHAVIFVDLPPISRPETLLVAEKLPAVLWVGAGGQQPDSNLGDMLNTYRKAGCRVLGAMMSGVPRLQPALLNQFNTAMSALAVLMTLGWSFSAQADTIPAKLATAPGLESPASANTQRKLPPVKLAPGDSVNLNLFGRSGYDRNEVFIQPDGHLTYLQADVMATGLTLDELRAALAKELSKYHQNPMVIVTPDRFQSRKVYILGKVVKKGMVNYDRPLTLLEAVTEAGGLEIGLFEQNTVELADLGRSFVSRGGQRLDVDFRGLFYRGEMSQNILLQPDDYIYFPSANSNEVYVLGNVANQGTQGLLGHSTVTSVIASTGGFTDKAYKDRVLVVRGSLTEPKTFVVNMKDVLSGREKGFRLEPKDIIFVADKPWARAEELVEMALNAFVYGAATGFVTGNVAPIITKPWITPSIQTR